MVQVFTQRTQNSNAEAEVQMCNNEDLWIKYLLRYLNQAQSLTLGFNW
jgi:hypothetical protein